MAGIGIKPRKPSPQNPKPPGGQAGMPSLPKGTAKPPVKKPGRRP